MLSNWTRHRRLSGRQNQVRDRACVGQKISAKQLKTDEGGERSCANTLWGLGPIRDNQAFLLIVMGC